MHAIITAKSLEGAGLNSVTDAMPIHGWHGAEPIVPFRPALATHRAVHVGEPVALVLAETEAQAQDAAEMVAVDYTPLEPAIDTEKSATGRTSAPKKIMCDTSTVHL